MMKIKSPLSAGLLVATFALAGLFLISENRNIRKLRIPDAVRRVSLDLGGGNCQWTAPVPDFESTFRETLIVGFPSGDKRITFVQMEGLTGLPTRDEWHFGYGDSLNEPFVKANYPHHEGTWGWEYNDKVVMVVKNMRRALVEYHDILWDIGYAKTREDAFLLTPNLYFERPPLEDWYVWRDLRVMDEIHWYGWFIDYWMEGGLMRDMFTHKITTPEHWNMLMLPTHYTVDELRYDRIVGDQVVTPSYDPNCENHTPYHDNRQHCIADVVVSGDNLVDHELGPIESAKVALLLENVNNVNVISPEARKCIWEELIIRKKGLKTFIDREGLNEYSYKFTNEMLEEMVHELDRLITKYSLPEWYSKSTAKDLVMYLTGHRTMIQEELDEQIASGGV